MGFLSDGKKVEQKFAELFSNVRTSTKLEDISEHFDLEIKIKVDVKSLKKKSRSDDSVDENIHWVEIKNVNGESGWLYGMAQYFAFETEKYWVIVEKEALQNFISENTIKEFSNYPIINKLYRRKDRKDIITLVKTIDLIYISTTLIKKKEI